MLAGYLPKEWNGKRVAVRFARGRGFDARLVGDNAGGITVEPIKEEDAEEDEEERPGAHSSLGLPCGISSCWKNPASPRRLDQKNSRQKAGGARALVGCGSRLTAFGPDLMV